MHFSSSATLDVWFFTKSYLMWCQVQAVNYKELNRKGLFHNIFNFIPQSLCTGSKVRYDFEPRFCRSFCLLPPKKGFFLGSVASCRVPSAICRVAAAAAAGERGEDFSLSVSGSDLVRRWQQTRVRQIGLHGFRTQIPGSMILSWTSRFFDSWVLSSGANSVGQINAPIAL